MTDQPKVAQQDKDRTETARRHDDHDLIESTEPGPSASGASGGRIATDIASRDDERQELDSRGDSTRPEKKDKVQPFIATRADNDGANG